MVAFTDILLLLVGVYYFVKLLGKRDYRPAAVFFLIFFLSASAATVCGTLFHINRKMFFSVQWYGTMFLGGIVCSSLSLAAIFDNFKARTAWLLTVPILMIAAIYYYVSFFVAKASFLPFVAFQLLSVIILMAAYLKQLNTNKTKNTFMAGFSSILAGLVEIPQFNVLVFNQDDIFHFLSIITLYFIYKTAAMHEDVRV